MINSGVGFTNLNKLLTSVNIPSISFTTHKRYEEEAGRALESIAKDSCERAVEIEKQLTVNNMSKLEQNL